MIISAIVVTLAVTTSLIYRRMKLRFKLWSYDYNNQEDNNFYGSDEMAKAYEERLKNKTIIN